MPEFVLEHGSRAASKRWLALDPFTRGYIEAMFFTDTGHREDGELENVTLADLDDSAWLEIAADCIAWQAANAALLSEAYELGYEPEQAGRDYWYSRNGHGVGFWDRDVLRTADGLGDKLSAACRYQELNLYKGDSGKLFVS